METLYTPYRHTSRRKDIQLHQHTEESFGQFLYNRLRELNTNARQFHLASGIRQGTISAWINDQRKPNPEYCRVIADYLALSVDEVLERAGHRPRMQTDPDPAREEIRRIVWLLPEEELELVRDFSRWRLARAGNTPIAHAARVRHDQSGSSGSGSGHPQASSETDEARRRRER